jgi:hypothetical protein
MNWERPEHLKTSVKTPPSKGLDTLLRLITKFLNDCMAEAIHYGLKMSVSATEMPTNN